MKHYAVADLHGRYDLFLKIKELLQEDDILIVLGDCGDRGPDGWKLIKTVYEDPQCVYLKGNHEDMLVNAMHGDTWLTYINGGANTLDGWLCEGEDPEWTLRLDTLWDCYVYINENFQEVILCHSGFTPFDAKKSIFDLNIDMLWDRDHFFDTWPSEDRFKNTIIVHGHTPIELMTEYLPVYPQRNKALWYCDGHKVNIDNGAVWNNVAIVLDLDTFEEITVSTLLDEVE